MRHVTTPDVYRTPDSDTGERFAAEVEKAVRSLQDSGHGVSAMILCPFFFNEGFPILPSGFLDKAVAIVRKAGGVIISDEVQPGFGRLGTHFWGHQKIGIRPDIVTMGKPMGNGHPVAAVATSLDIMAAFRKAFRYFNTFGGNPVSCAAANAVLDVLEKENLMERAQETGNHAQAGLKRLAQKYPIIGEVRGSGLSFGVELVVDRQTKEPAGAPHQPLTRAWRPNGPQRHPL